MSMFSTANLKMSSLFKRLQAEDTVKSAKDNKDKRATCSFSTLDLKH